MPESANGYASGVKAVAGGYEKIDKAHLNSDVPFEIDHIPRPRSLRLQVRFVRGLMFAAWLFVRAIFWQVYANRYMPGVVSRTNLDRWVKWAREYRRFAISMGGVYIKLGQFISTRVDALPEAIVQELASLQDEVPTIEFKHIRRVLKDQLGPLEQRFEWFSETPIAAASLGQAHRAKLRSGERVVVKVQRPGIRGVCYTDLRTIKIVASVAGRFKFFSRRANMAALAGEFGTVLLEELSYQHEAANAARFAEMFRDDMGVYVPEVYTQHSTDQVLTMEDVTSLKLTDYAALEAAGISRKEVAQRLMETYLKQIFECRLFHADPHPGNLFIYPLPVDDVRPYLERGGGRPFYLIFIDFGMTGALTKEIADGMVNTLAAVITRDPDKMVNSYVKLGFVLPGADLERIKEATQAAFDTVWGMSMSEIRDMDYQQAANLASEFSDLIKSMPFYIPQDFIYLGRTVSILSGMATTLDPNFNPWHEMEPYAQQLIAQGFGVDLNLKNGQIASGVFESLFSGNGGQVLVNFVQEINRRTTPINPAMQALELLRSGELKVIAEPGVTHRASLRRLESRQQTQTRAIIFGSALITSTLFYTNGDAGIALAGYAFCAAHALYGFFKG